MEGSLGLSKHRIYHNPFLITHTLHWFNCRRLPTLCATPEFLLVSPLEGKGLALASHHLNTRELAPSTVTMAGNIQRRVAQQLQLDPFSYVTSVMCDDPHIEIAQQSFIWRQSAERDLHLMSQSLASESCLKPFHIPQAEYSLPTWASWK